MTNFSGETLNAGTGGPKGVGMDSRHTENQVAEVSAQYLIEAESSTPFGFKNTEVGTIPSDWEAKSLGEYVEIYSGESPSKFEFLPDGVPYFKVEQLNNGSVFADSTPYFIKNSKKVLAGSVIFPKRGASILSNKIRVLKQDSFMDTNLMALTCLKGLQGLYLYNQLTYRGLDSVADTTSIPQINNKHIIPYIIPVPCEREQTAIANALSDVDVLISELEKLIAKKQAIKTATMQQLLTGRTRLPQFALREDGSPKGYKSSELGEVPEDWTVVCFDELKDKKDNWAITGGPFGSNLKASDYTENGVRVIQLQNIGDGAFKNDDFVYTSHQKANDLISCNIYPDEIILSKMGDPVARACLIPHFHSRYVMCSDGIRLKVDSQKYSAKFVFYFLNYPLFRNQALDASTGSTRKRIGLSELRDLLLFSPSKEEQTAIATILSDMNAEIEALEQRLGKTHQIKQGMMQELLTGKTRLIQGSEAR